MIKYPLAKQTITNDEMDFIARWLLTHPKLTMGEITKQFEEEWAKYIGTKYAAFVNSGSSANLLAIYALLMSGKLKRGDKVAVPAVGWGTTIAPIIQLGLIPVMFDVCPFTFGIDVTKVINRIKMVGDISAVMFVQVLGVPISQLEELKKACEIYGVPLIEDSCAALGSKSADGKMVGSFGDLSTFSFYFGHQLSTIEGGMINTNNFELYEILLMSRSHGWGKDLSNETYSQMMMDNNIDEFHKPFTFFIPGFNLRPTDLQAKIGLGQMKKAEWCANRRNENHRRYIDQLRNTCEFQFPLLTERISSISFGVLSKDRKKIVESLVANGIETRLFSAGNLARHPFWVGEKDKFPVADIIHDEGFFLPNYPELTLNDVDIICNIVKDSI